MPSRKLIKTAEQIEGIRRSSAVNTGVLDLIAKEIKADMSTAEIDKLGVRIIRVARAIPGSEFAKDLSVPSALLSTKWSVTVFPVKMRYWKKEILLM